MKTKHVYLAALLFLYLNVPVHAQSEAIAFDGLQNSLNEFVDAAAQTYESLNLNYDEYIRLRWLVNSDIRMVMNMEFDEEMISSGSYGYGGLFSNYQSAREGSVYIKFDWQNMAQSMYSTVSGSSKLLSISPYTMDGTNKGDDFVAYVDAQGYWYVPVDNYGYMRVSIKKKMKNVASKLALSIDAAIATGATEMMDQLLAAMLTMDLGALGIGSFYPWLPPEIFAALADPNVDVAAELLSSMTPLLEAEMKSILGNLPPFIHFAFVISPDMARSRFEVQEETITWRGQEHCTKMILLSGKDKGYQMVFDPYNRLINLKDTDDSSAEYWYDRDVTVTIPSAITLGF